MNLEAGTELGRYVIKGPLGKGGMSDVFLAFDGEGKRDVVLKFPHADLMGDPKTHEHFQREVKIGRLLDHPNIQKLYDLGGDARNPFLVLEYVPGVTLREEMAGEAHQRRFEQPAERIEVTRRIGAQLARALAYAHTHHVSHRDLKPENIIVTADGQAKVMDFGVAFIEGARRVTWGALSSQVGTPDYMAPEQIRGVRGDHRTDIYALGMMLYELIAHRLPYEGDNALAIMSQHVNENAPLLHRFCKEVPPAIEEIVMKSIRRSPDERYQSMNDFIAALEHPELVDVAALQADREKQQPSSRPLKGIAQEVGVPIWKILLIVALIFGTLMLIGFGGQLASHRR